MANPAPIISSIGAFDKNNGTTIYYNVIGATEIIRASRVQIYAVSDNSLKLSYLYTGAMQSGGQYQLVIPASETMGVLVNGNQYYARIETYTATNGITGASGYSVAKIFWCLATPTLTPPTIPSPVATTTYNAIFTYTYQGNVANKIQQYELELLEGNIVRETSGVVIGNGTQVSAQSYQASYNFTTLVDDGYYTIRCTILTTEGMVITATSNAFRCSITAPSFSAASVSNNACGGYITISSQITNIEGVLYGGATPEPQYIVGGGVDLTQGGYIDWTEGITIASVNNINNWTLHLWAKNLSTIEAFVQDDALVYLETAEGIEILGKMGVFITEDDEGHIRAEMLVDIDGTEGNIATYHTDYINTPLDTDTIYLRVRCINNWFDVMLMNLDEE